MKQAFPATCLLIFLAFSAFAQTTPELPELDSDRPNFTQAATVVPARTIQLETGLGYEKDTSQNKQKRNLLYPTTLVRIGVLKKAELRINFDFEQENEKPVKSSNLAGEEAKEKGFDNVQIGTKIALVKSQGAIPDIGLLASLSLPVGIKEFRPPHAAPSVQLLFNTHFSKKLELQYNFGYRKHKDENEYLVQLLYSASALLHLTDNLLGFTEFQAFKPIHQSAENSLAGGLMYKLLLNLQLDVLGGIGVSNSAPDFYTGVGVTWRVPR